MDTMVLKLKGLFQTRAHWGGILWVMRIVSKRVYGLRRVQAWIDGYMNQYSNKVSLGFDEKFGTDTFPRLDLKTLNVGACLDWSWLYGPINPDFFHEMIGRLPVDVDKYTFVDVGAGKGLGVMLASQYSFEQLLAIEFAEELVEIGKLNVLRYSEEAGFDVRVEWVCEDFMNYQLPDRPLIMFFNNPFPEDISKRAIAHVQTWLSQDKRDAIVIYRKTPKSVTEMFGQIQQLRLLTWSPYWQAYSTH